MTIRHVAGSDIKRGDFVYLTDDGVLVPTGSVMKTEDLISREEEEESTTWKLSTYNKTRIERTERHVLFLQGFAIVIWFTLIVLFLLILSLGDVI